MDNFEAIVHVVPVSLNANEELLDRYGHGWTREQALHHVSAIAWRAYSKAWPEAMAQARLVIRSPWAAEPSWTRAQMTAAGFLDR